MTIKVTRTFQDRGPCCTPSAWVWASCSRGNCGSDAPAARGWSGCRCTRPNWAGNLKKRAGTFATLRVSAIKLPVTSSQTQRSRHYLLHKWRCRGRSPSPSTGIGWAGRTWTEPRCPWERRTLPAANQRVNPVCEAADPIPSTRICPRALHIVKTGCSECL